MADAARKAQGNVIPIHNRYEALKWGDEWRERAIRTQAQLERTQMLLFCAEVHEKASEILLADALGEVERLRNLLP